MSPHSPDRDIPASLLFQNGVCAPVLKDPLADRSSAVSCTESVWTFRGSLHPWRSPQEVFRVGGEKVVKPHYWGATYYCSNSLCPLFNGNLRFGAHSCRNWRVRTQFRR